MHVSESTHAGAVVVVRRCDGIGAGGGGNLIPKMMTQLTLLRDIRNMRWGSDVPRTRVLELVVHFHEKAELLFRLEG